MSILNEYKDFVKNEFNKKQNKKISYLKSKLLIYKQDNKDKRFTLYDKYLFEQKIIKAKVQDEITSVSLKMKNQIVIFNTPTLDPSLNIENNDIKTIQAVSGCLKQQYNELQTFSNKMKKYNYIEKNERIDFKFQSVSRFELTKKLNIHRHNIDIVDSFQDLLTYCSSRFIRTPSQKYSDSLKVEIF